MSLSESFRLRWKNVFSAGTLFEWEHHFILEMSHRNWLLWTMASEPIFLKWPSSWDTMLLRPGLRPWTDLQKFCSEQSLHILLLYNFWTQCVVLQMSAEAFALTFTGGIDWCSTTNHQWNIGDTETIFLQCIGLENSINIMHVLRQNMLKRQISGMFFRCSIKYFANVPG